ncbi:TRAP transporter small permease subunit [Saccharospirillum salsuginis]|uniref:TRAP transporter small permease protein n=1 Tax=Saccharospirillum salsuginis TaxID=418750 RepID=A0A918K8F9_9GAMM|nr:TRAP transporter small permease subunit [Saccharospirillum salsuginis]GGX54419.1 C4-dicarboxylate ABC transporter substrate-binding protein [Saccharospirillum salsuginis]
MAGSASVLTDSSRLSRIDRWVYKLESWLTMIAGITILALVFIAVVNILGRWLFNMPLRGYIDWVEQLMAVFAFLGIAYCQRLGGHIRMDLLVGALRGRALWLSEFVTVFFMLLVTLILTYGSYLHFLRAYTNGDSSIDIGLPIWPAKLIVPIGLALLSLRLILQLWGYARAFRLNSTEPVAVPLVEDAATVAQREAESLEGGDIEGDEPKGGAQ